MKFINTSLRKRNKPKRTSRLILILLISVLLVPFIFADDMDIHNGATIVTTHQEWVTTKQTGAEKGLIFWTADQFDKKTHIGWIIDEANYLGDTAPRVLMDCNHIPIMDNKDKEISLKYETSKCDGQDCWSIALTDDKAVNVPDCITIGEHSMVNVYMNISKVVHDFNGKQINATLLKEVSGEFVHAPDDLFLRNTEIIKFGAVDSYPSDENQTYKYLFDSTDYIYKESSYRYYIVTGREDVDLMRYEEQREYIDVTDICWNQSCIYNLTNNNESNYLHVTFMCSNYTDGKCYIDPEFETYEITLSSGYFNKTLYNDTVGVQYNMSLASGTGTWHTEVVQKTNASHNMANVTATMDIPAGTSVSVQVLHKNFSWIDGLQYYWDFDGVKLGNTQTVQDLMDKRSLDTYSSTNANIIESGKFGRGIRFNDDNGYILMNDTEPLYNENITVCLWFNHSESGTSSAGDLYNLGSDGWNFYHDTSNNNGIVFRTRGCNIYYFEDDRPCGYGLPANEWHHVCVWVNQTHCGKYIGGQTARTETTTSGSINTGRVSKIGNSRYNIRDLNGTVDEVMVWNRTLTEEEIGNIYNWTSWQYLDSQSLSDGNNELNFSIDNNTVFAQSKFSLTSSATDTPVIIDTNITFYEHTPGGGEEPPEDTCTYSGDGAWNIDLCDNCVIVEEVTGDGSSLSTYESSDCDGSLTLDADVINFNPITLTSTDSNTKGIVTCSGGCFK